MMHNHKAYWLCSARKCQLRAASLGSEWFAEAKRRRTEVTFAKSDIGLGLWVTGQSRDYRTMGGLQTAKTPLLLTTSKTARRNDA